MTGITYEPLPIFFLAEMKNEFLKNKKNYYFSNNHQNFTGGKILATIGKIFFFFVFHFFKIYFHFRQKKIGSVW